MRLYEFAENIRYTCLKDTVIVKQGDRCIITCRIEDLPWRCNPNRHPRFKWADEHIEKVTMEAIHTPGTLSPRYTVTIELVTEPYPVI